MKAEKMVMSILLSVALAHLLNDLIQAVVSAVYPMLKDNYALSFSQIGLLAFVYQVTASLIQPWIGLYTDKHPKPLLLPAGTLLTLAGILLLALAPNFAFLLVAVCLVGMGSAIFHPEASRVARMASGGKFGTAQSLFQVGGNSGSALGPLVCALFIVPLGQSAIVSIGLLALALLYVLYRISLWVRAQPQTVNQAKQAAQAGLAGKTLLRALGVIMLLMIVKFTYIASLSNYFTFYLMDKFQLTLASAQLYLFAFLGAVALGTFAGGPIGDKIGRNKVIWFSFIGMAPFALLLPSANLAFTIVFAILAGFIMSSAFSAMVVYAQEAVPGRVGMISGLMFGVMFGISGIAAALLGFLADQYGIQAIFTWCGYLPILGLAALWLPKRG
ncbi:Fosmidomycin resistance protein [Pasteurellaceae bacterium RH1A]|nr:Fosmidomycin resistance protein [Pasteurellaceae bacterium RH1A]